jgi:hypothetical protein
MHRFRLPFAGLLMVGIGGYLLFTNPQQLPLWFVWLVGAFLWYAGLAVTIGGLAAALFFPRAAQPVPVADEVRVLKLRNFARRHPAPSGILREIPAMGGFIL